VFYFFGLRLGWWRDLNRSLRDDRCFTFLDCVWGGGGLLIDPYGMTGVLLFWIAYGVVARFE
jgi:hypothetical protein